MAWQFNPYAIILIILTIPLIWIANLAWKNRHDATSRAFFCFIVLTVGLVICYTGELFSANLTLIRFWLNLEYVFLCATIAYFIFALSYAGNTSFLRPIPILSLFIVPAIIVPLVWTNEQHHLVWEATGTKLIDGLVLFDRTYGPAFWMWAFYLNILLIVASFVLLRAGLRKPGIFRRQVILLSISIAIPWVTFYLTVTQLTPIPLIDVVPFGAALQSIPLAYTLYAGKLLEVLPVSYQRIAQYTSDLLLVCNADYRLLEANPAALDFLKLTSKKALGESLHDIAPFLVDDQCLDRERVRTVVTEDGTHHYYEIRQVPIPDRLGIARNYIIIVRDLTLQRLADERRIALELERERTRLMQEFVQNISHDFRTRLASMTSTAFMLQRLLAREDETIASMHALHPKGGDTALLDSLAGLNQGVKTRVDAQEANAFQLAKMVDNMLNLMRLDNRPEMSFRAYNLNTLAEEVIGRAQTSTSKKGLQLRFTPCLNLPPLCIDDWELRHAFENLIDNAIHFTPVGGSLSIRTYVDADNAVIEFADTGIGIPETDLPHIFERFFRADKARQTELGGAGLGLPVVKHVVDAHRGRIDVTSVPRKGTTVRVYLPLAPVGDAALAAQH